MQAGGRQRERRPSIKLQQETQEGEGSGTKQVANGIRIVKRDRRPRQTQPGEYDPPYSKIDRIQGESESGRVVQVCGHTREEHVHFFSRVAVPLRTAALTASALTDFAVLESEKRSGGA